MDYNPNIVIIFAILRTDRFAFIFNTQNYEHHVIV